MSTFPDVKKKLGFGCMRLPMDGEKVDYVEFTKMVDEFMAQGFNYFDTARVYIGGQGETAIRDCVVKRYPATASFSPTSSPIRCLTARTRYARCLKSSSRAAEWTTSTSTSCTRRQRRYLKNTRSCTPMSTRSS